jgi:3-dehydroquinate dehydratase
MFCIPIIAKDTEEALRKMAMAAPLADIIEVRLDLMNSFDLGPIISSSVRPVLITYRSEKEGGMGKDDPDTVAGYLVSAIKEGTNLIGLHVTSSRGSLTRVSARAAILLRLLPGPQDGMTTSGCWN